MPGVTLLPSTPPANGPMSNSYHQNGSTTTSSSPLAPAPNPSTRPYGDLTLSEIKQKAKEGVAKEARGVSAITLIKTARTQILAAKEHEARGDLRTAFGSYIKAATLAKMTMDSPEYLMEAKGKGGVVRRELNDFLEGEGHDISARTNAVEEKLRAMEKAQAAAADTSKKTSLSIADRLRALQDNGLSLGQTRLRDTSGAGGGTGTGDLPTPPISPRSFPSVPSLQAQQQQFSSSSNSHSYSNSISTPLIPSPTQVAPSTSTSSQSIHALVSPASLGPPSPTSTPSSSPPTNSLLNSNNFSSNYDININGFNQAFPSIDELDEDPAFSLPSVPTGPIGVGVGNGASSKPPYRNGHAYDRPSAGSPLQSFKNFTVPIERPSSTPITPINNSFQSRPASPSPDGSGKSTSASRAGAIPHKPSGLSMGISATSSSSTAASSTSNTPNVNGSSSSSGSRPRTPIPNKNAATPRELLGYMREHSVLLIDVRSRAEFEREHVNASAVVCIEPGVLMREGVTAETLEQTLLPHPRSESSLFTNRDKFDLVAVYDSSSTSFGPPSSPLSVLVRVISEQAFRKMLKRMPMVLVGGLEAWRREVGEGGVVRGGGGSGTQYQDQVTIQRPVPTTGVVSPLLASSASTSASGSGSMNPYMNGPSTSTNGTSAHHQHELWTPPQRLTRMESGNGGGFAEHRSTMSLDQGSGVHSRMPADAGYNGIHPPPAVNGDRSLARRPAILRPSSGSISFTRSMNDTITSPTLNGPSISNTPFNPSSSSSTSHTPITYPQFPRHISPTSTSSASTPSGSSSSSNLSSSSSATTTTTLPPSATAPSYITNSATLPPPQTQTQTQTQMPYDIASPPQASINPSSLSRRRSDFVDQSQEALSLSSSSLHMQGYNAHARVPLGPIDYPDLSLSMGMGAMSLGGGGMGHGSGGMGGTMVRPPPPVAAPAALDHGRQDSRRALASPPATAGLPPSSSSSSTALVSANTVGGPTGVGGLTGLNGPVPPRIASDYPVVYWPDVNIGVSGLKNLGNTCYMNAPIQCLSATVPFSRFFTEGRWRNAVNYTNPLGSKGKLASAFAKLLHEMWGGDLPYLTPIDFRKSICQLNTQYNGSDQHDSQEFLSFLIDGIHEDLNRIIAKPPKYTPTPEEDAELERLPPQIASEREWRAWRARNDSLIVDFFQGQFRNRLECLTCHKTSTTYNVFSILSLPVPNMRSGKVPIERCIDAFFNEEVLEKDDAWDCPQCKTKRRASKKLSLARLPPILVIHLKRFEANGRFSDKIDTFVDFPMKSLDLTNYMPPPLPPGADRSQLNGGLPMSLEDPRTQVPPYRYDLYGVTNHYGNLSSGHYTAFIASRGGWMYCDDSSVKPVDAKQVVSQKAYVLFYKRVRP